MVNELEEIINKIKEEKRSCYMDCNLNDSVLSCSVEDGWPKCDCGRVNTNNGLDEAIEIIRQYENKNSKGTKIYFPYNLTKKSWENYKKNPILLCDHEFTKPMGKVEVIEDESGIWLNLILNKKIEKDMIYDIAVGFAEFKNNEKEILEASIINLRKKI